MVVALLLLVCAIMDAAAQDEGGMMHVQCQVTLEISKEDEFKTVQYATFKSYEKAVKAENRITAALTAMVQPGAKGTEVDDECSKLGIVWKKSQTNGTFNLNVMEGQGVLVFADQMKVHAFEIKKGKTKYSEVIKFDQTDQTLPPIEKIGHYRNLNPVMKKVPAMDTGYETRFNINLILPKGYTKDDSRLIVQPLAVDCQNEDTIAYLPPIVFEGDDYHRLQDRRMAYSYFVNDSLARGYCTSQTLQTQKAFGFDTTVVFRKPDKDKTYKGAYYCVLEDYHHIIWSNGGEGTGSCLAFRPFKFLDFTVAAAEMPLTTEFREDAESNISTIPRDLSLKFEVGTDKLTNDSANNVEMSKLLEELRSYGERLWNVKVQGSASPEGNYELNKTLADKRAAMAFRMLRSKLPSDVRVSQLGAHIYTWNDVLSSVEAQGNQEITDMVRNVVSNNKESDIYGILKGLPFYETAIAPILESQRIMKCSYTYEREHVMDAAEAVQDYYANKHDYISGKKDRFSDGDYYNLFANVKDSLELDTITMLAYKHMIKQPGYKNLKFSPYVANRMALLNIRRGTPDPNVLRPFIDYSVKKIDLKRYIDQFTMRVINRHEILINQAVNYFQEQKLDTAQYILEWLPNNANTEKLRMFITFSRNYIRYISGDTSPEETAAVRQAETYVLNTNQENRAIIYSELHSQLDKSRTDAEAWVDKMPDDNPKKWYLKGILWSDEAGQEPAVDGGSGDDFQELSDMEQMELQQKDPAKYAEYLEALDKHEAAKAAARLDKTPYFLAYFQHSFDLEPKFKKLYYNEGNVSDDIREKFKYRKKDIPAYRRKFNALIAQRDRLASMAEDAGATPTEGNEAAADKDDTTTEKATTDSGEEKPTTQEQ